MKSVALAEIGNGDIAILGFSKQLSVKDLRELPNPYFIAWPGSARRTDVSAAEEGVWPYSALIEGEVRANTLLGLSIPKMVCAYTSNNPDSKALYTDVGRVEFGRRVAAGYAAQLLEIGYHDMPGRFVLAETDLGLEMINIPRAA